MEEVIRILILAVMAVCAVVDIRKKEISVKLIVLLGLVAISNCIFGRQQELVMAMAGVVPGILMLIFAKITEQSIGYGDGIILAEIGLVTGAGKCMLILAVALAMAGLFSLGIIVIKKVDKKYKIPFIPFLTLSYLLV